MNYRDDLDKLKLAKRDASQLTIFHEWSQAHPEFNYQAAHSILKSYYNGEPWTLENLQASAERLAASGAIHPLDNDRIQSDAASAREDAQEAEARERQELVNFIIANRQMQPQTAQEERKRLMSPVLTAIETVRNIAANVKAKREMQNKSVPELRTIAKGEPQSQWKPIPQIYRNKSMLISLANENISEFRRLVARCGRAQVDAILAQPSTETD